MNKIRLFDNLYMDVFDDNFSSIFTGMSGSGKSRLVFSMIKQYLDIRLKVSVNGGTAVVGPLLYVHDNKRSDLSIIGRELGDKYVGYSHADIFRFLNLFLDEMDRREQVWTDLGRNAFGINSIASLGYPPMLLIIEEFGVLSKELANDKKKYRDFMSKLSIIASKGRSSSMGVWIILQQGSTDFVTSDIRENMVNKFLMGIPDGSQNSSMLLGVPKDELPDVSNEKGAGLLRLADGRVRAFVSPYFDLETHKNDFFDFMGNMRNVVEFTEKVVSEASEERRAIMELERTKNNARLIGDTSEEIEFLEKNGKTYEVWGTDESDKEDLF